MAVTLPQASRRHHAGGFFHGVDTSIHILFWARIVNRTGDFVQMLLVLILTVHAGMDELQAGFFVTMTLVASSVGQLLVGPLADKHPRVLMFIACQMAVAIFHTVSGLFIVGGQYAALPYLIMLSSPFRGATWPLSNALVADFSSGEEQRARAFSLLYLGSNIGVAIGPIVASFLFERNLALLFFGSAATMAFSSAIIAWKLPVRLAPLADEVPEPTDPHRPFFKVLFANPVLVLHMSAFLVYNFVYVQHTFALPLQLNDLFGSGVGTKTYGYLMTVNAVTVLAMTHLLTRVTIHKSRTWNMAFAAWFYVVGFILYAFTSSIAVFYLSTFIWTNGEILLATNGNVFVNQHAPRAYRARFNSASSVFTGIGSMLGPYLGGLLLTGSDYRSLWLWCTVFAVVLSFLFIGLGRMVAARGSAVSRR